MLQCGGWEPEMVDWLSVDCWSLDFCSRINCGGFMKEGENSMTQTFVEIIYRAEDLQPGPPAPKLHYKTPQSDVGLGSPTHDQVPSPGYS